MPKEIEQEIKELCAIMVQGYEEYAAQVGESCSSDEDMTPFIELMD